jgi:diguanylate cyclase (GGDEF)-like protein
MIVVAARLIASLGLLAVLGPAVAGALLDHPPELPAWALIHPGARLSLVLLGIAVLLTSVEQIKASRALAGLSLLMAVLMLAASTAAATRGASFASGSHSLIDVLRPTVLTTLGIAALAGSLAWRREGALNLDGSVILGVGASAIFFLVTVGHLFGASSLTRDPFAAAAQSSGLAATLLLGLSLAALATHGGGPVLDYVGDETGAVARRRLLPAAVLTPIAAGFLLLYAMDGRELSPALAVALTVFMNVAVMLALIDRAGHKVARVAQTREEKLQARAEAARRQGNRDALTGLTNRRGWDSALAAAEKRCRAEGFEAAVWMIDLDGLKRVNDSEGHKAGDALIRAAAEALRSAARRGDTLARLGGDEFAYLVIDCDADAAAAVQQRLERALANAQVRASLGHALSSGGALAPAVESADQAMYQRKRAAKLRRA